MTDKPETKTRACHWWSEDDNYEDEWRTQCGGLFTLTCDTPKEHGMKFCCYCGKKLEEGKI